MARPRLRIRTLLLVIAVVALWLSIARNDLRMAYLILALPSYIGLSSFLFTAAILGRERLGKPASHLGLLAFAVAAWAGTFLAPFLALVALWLALFSRG